MSRRKRMMQGLDEDIREHIAMETQENIERGMSAEDARYAAMRKFGNVTLVKENTRAVWSIVWIKQSLQDPFVLASVAFTVLVTGTLSIAGPVRRALHIDRANLLREQ